MDTGRVLRSAVAAALAWLALVPLGGLADMYPYYGPLGAVIAVTTTVVGSVRESAQTVLAIAVGVTLGGLAAPLPSVVGILLVVGVGVAVGTSPAARFLGAAASWAPVTGMFVLVIGGDPPWEYAAAYLGLTAYGALVGTVVCLAWPPLPVVHEERTLEDGRAALARHLDLIADALSGDDPPTPEEWRDQVGTVEDVVDRMRVVATEARQVRRVNWRARRWQEAADARWDRVHDMERLALLVDDLSDLVRDQEHAGRQRVALGPELRPATARALAAIAQAMRTVDADRPPAVRHAQHTVELLVDRMRDVRTSTGDDLVTAGAVVTAAGRALAMLSQSDSPLPRATR
jgi:uncharacterized membrane protein YgaE (UPF0421/DUF939 family)